jgi:flavin-dependent dehydrogenase
MELFYQIKTGDYPFSYKIKDSYPVRMWGTGPSRVNVGKPLSKTYKDGMMIIGSAAGFNGIQPAILTGRFAAEVAVDAIHAGNVTAAKLARYQDMWKATGMEHLYDYWRSLRLAMSGMKDKGTLEKDLEERVKRGEELITSFIENYL